MTKKMMTYAPKSGLLAVEPKAWGLDFVVMASDAECENFERIGDAAVVDIRGPLVSKDSWCWDSYEAIQERLSAAFASDCARVIMRVDSPGGDVAGCFELAAWMRDESARTGKALVAFTDGRACSAAYALASAAGQFVITPTATIGSIGVIEATVDVTAQDAAMGVRFLFAASGARKTDGNPHVAITKEAAAAMQANVDGLAQLFYALVSVHRGMPEAQVAALEAGTFFGANAVALGLADVTMTWPELVSGSQGDQGDKQMTVKAQSGANSAQGAQAKSDGITSSLMKIIDGDDEAQSKAAKKMLAKYLNESAKDGDEDGDEPKKEEGKAAEEEPKKDSEKMKAAAASAPDTVAMARELHALKAEIAAEKDSLARQKILASRPDLSPEAVKALASVSTNSLQAIVDTFPRIVNPAAAAASVSGTRGDTQGDGKTGGLPAHTEAAIDIRMGRASAQAKIENKGHEQILPLLTPDQARAHLAALKGGN